MYPHYGVVESDRVELSEVESFNRAQYAGKNPIVVTRKGDRISHSQGDHVVS